METKFNFKSQICTTVEQSLRLLGLGLKKETADCHYTRLSRKDDWTAFIGLPHGYHLIPNDYLLPAWSLDRLMELVPHRFGEYCDYANYFMYYYNIPFDVMEQFRGETRYEYLIDCIEWLIKQGYFNKEYLV